MLFTLLLCRQINKLSWSDPAEITIVKRECTRRVRSSRMKAMLDNFLQILPEVIFDAAEKLGGRCTGRFYALNALENRVYDIEMEEGPHVIIKFYRPGRWSRATIQAEHDFLKALEESEIPVVSRSRTTRDKVFSKLTK